MSDINVKFPLAGVDVVSLKKDEDGETERQKDIHAYRQTDSQSVGWIWNFEEHTSAYISQLAGHSQPVPLQYDNYVDLSVKREIALFDCVCGCVDIFF